MGVWAIPSTRAEDALHISLATVHGMDFLVTWNFRPINNAEKNFAIRISQFEFDFLRLCAKNVPSCLESTLSAVEGCLRGENCLSVALWNTGLQFHRASVSVVSCLY